MATWHVGPFDNDDAADWCDSLHEAPAAERREIVWRALEVAALARSDVTAADAARAVAAAAVVLHSLTGAPQPNSPHMPSLSFCGDAIEVDDALLALAVQAIDAVLAQTSGWRRQWADDVEEDEALTIVGELRTRLTDTRS
ncbi:DUF4259 domain-containing protein [Phytohabitans suffuscus]|uniref:DUF4259 domain-containing protein n=1 Tax=Phytohabitans suffuscus TaxID=624315 RepID=A0A6F8YJ73_9ACTN|nr:DUF4259 domain-containing protein [Phytohabitans suffuscus]BCB86083.1 hypothetical protein Psuf_033960 [Phytohabitans suffuscus]